MKKFICITLCLIMVCTFFGCTAKTKSQKFADGIVKICDQFMNNDITASECKERLEEMYVPDYNDEEEGSVEHFELFNLASRRDHLIYCLSREDYSGFNETYESVKEYLK